MSWIEVEKKPLIPGISSPMAVTESQDVPNEIRMFRGTTTLAYPIDKIALALCEPSARLKWVERMAIDQVFEGSIEEGEWLSYEGYDLVWPVSNRDYVFRQTLEKTVHEDRNRRVVRVTSIEHPDYPITPERVRGDLPTCTFTLDEVKENETQLEVVVQVDPGGSLPGFVKNMIQKGWALKTMQALNTYMTNQS